MKTQKKKREPWKTYLARVDTPGLQKARRWSRLLFWCFYLCLIAALVVLGIRFYRYCYDSFVLYENGQVGPALEAVLADLNGADGARLSTLLTAAEPATTEFEDGAALLADRYRALAEKTLTAQEIRSVSADSRRYRLLADGVVVGEFSLTSTVQELRLGLLEIDAWEYAGGTVEFTYGAYSRGFTLPEGYTATVNDIPVGERWQTGEPVLPAEFAYVDAYVSMPRLVSYRVEGLLEEPRVAVYDNTGAMLAVTPDEAGDITLDGLWAEAQPTPEREALAVETAQLWANYALRDATLKEVQAVLIPDSALWQQVLDSNSSRNQIDAHRLLGYENVTVTAYIPYGADCFACRVTMDRTVYVNYLNGDVTDHLDNVFYLVSLNLDGESRWYIADMHAA